jgi:hypothetical protein
MLSFWEETERRKMPTGTLPQPERRSLGLAASPAMLVRSGGQVIEESLCLLR